MRADPLCRWPARQAVRLRHGAQHLYRRHLAARPFSGKAAVNLLLVTLGERIPQSQIRPFHQFAADLRRDDDAEVREIDLAPYLAAAQPGLDAATVIAFQTPFDIPAADLDRLIARMRARSPGARLAYLDWFAPTDLRMGAALGDRVDLYVKKHLLADRSAYGRPTRGDTNLTDHFSRRYGLDLPETLFRLPEGFFDRLVLGPSFVTASFMQPWLARPRPPRGPRPIDLHARMATAGTGWYQAMRRDCDAAAAALGPRLGLADIRRGEGISHSAFLREMTESRICFSPFGYGEVCWRDFEAAACGAVLLKQDMSHLRTDPDLFRARETYMPVRWDLSDLAERVQELRDDPALADRLRDTAFAVLHDYIRNRRFPRQMARLVAG